MAQPDDGMNEKKNKPLTEKDLYCMARVLQACLYTEDGLFGSCRYCLYQEYCNEAARDGKTYFTETVTGKLQDITGVFLGVNTCNIEEKLLAHSLQSTSRPGNKQ